MRFVETEGFTIVGISGRTSFLREKEPGGVIPELWGRAMGGALEAIPNRADGQIIALYTDYASDEYGEYTLLIGAKVTSAETVPDGMAVREVPASRCAVFTSERGPVQHVVIDLWKRIWREPRTAEYERSYRYDFEVYGAAAAEPANARIELFIGVK